MRSMSVRTVDYARKTYLCKVGGGPSPYVEGCATQMQTCKLECMSVAYTWAKTKKKDCVDSKLKKKMKEKKISTRKGLRHGK